MTTRRILKYIGQEVYSLEVWVTAKITGKTENPWSTESDLLVKLNADARMEWKEFRGTSDAKEALDKKTWEELEANAMKMLLDRVVSEMKPCWRGFSFALLYEILYHCFCLPWLVSRLRGTANPAEQLVEQGCIV